MGLTLHLDVKPEASPNPPVRGAIVDLSLGGARFESELPLEAGRKVYLSIEVPLEVFAEVVRVESLGTHFRYGVSFEDLSFFDRWVLRRYLKKRILSGGAL